MIRNGRCLVTLAACAFLLAVKASGSALPGSDDVVPPSKHVTIDKARQVLLAYMGDRLVFQCRVSTGRGKGWTPNGDFKAGEKDFMHYSTLFNYAPMPYSVQVTGNIFIHGFADVPPYPASHGCIRVPLNGDNPARQFFNWIEVGTPIRITGEWNGLPQVHPVLSIGPLN